MGCGEAAPSRTAGLLQRTKMRSLVSVTGPQMPKHYFGIKSVGSLRPSSSRPESPAFVFAFVFLYLDLEDVHWYLF